jgi:hypothetical protein
LEEITVGERVKVKFLKNYIAPVGAGISGQKDGYKTFPVSDQLTALLNDGTVELVGEGQAAKRETATVEAPEKTSKSKKAKSGE